MPTAPQTQLVDEDIRHCIEDMICDLGQDSFQQTHAPLYEKIENDSKKPLYSGCTTFTRLSSVLALVNLKARFGWSDKSFTEFLVLLKKMLPEDNTLPKNHYEVKFFYVRWEWSTRKSMHALMIPFCIEMSL